MINSSPLVAVAPGFTIDVSLLPLQAELEQRWSSLINADAVNVPPGWVPLILEMFIAIQRIQKNGKVASKTFTKIYEEDGELQVIYSTRSRAVHNLILEFVKRAQETCENCSWPGEPRSVLGAGFAVRCPVCAFLGNVRNYR